MKDIKKRLWPSFVPLKVFTRIQNDHKMRYGLVFIEISAPPSSLKVRTDWERKYPLS
jgi:hypothetical protein